MIPNTSIGLLFTLPLLFLIRNKYFNVAFINICTNLSRVSRFVAINWHLKFYLLV
jgi:hypothetical protein